MKLFDNIKHSNKTGRLEGESMWALINRSAQPTAGHVRCLLQKWFAAYPTKEQARLRGKLKSKKDEQFYSGFFELYLHALLCCLGLRVSIPVTEHLKEKIEDFKVYKGRSLMFRLEAKFVWKEAQHAIQDKYLRQVERALNGVSSKKVAFGMSCQGSFKKQPRYAKIANKFQTWLTSKENLILDLLTRKDKVGQVPFFEIKEAGVRIQVCPILVKDIAKGSKRPILIWAPGARHMETDRKLRNALHSKATKYGQMRKPYIIAVATKDPVDDIDMDNSLFGDGFFTRTTIGRKPNGFWRGPQGPHNTRVSAILLVSELSPETICQKQPIIYHNPWAENPLPIETLPLKQILPKIEIQESILDKRDGAPVSEILGLPSDWPRM